MGRNTHTQLMECQAELAREREARRLAEEDAQIENDRGNDFLTRFKEEFDRAEQLEGRVRELREALEEILENYDADGFVRERAREALVGLPERRERV